MGFKAGNVDKELSDPLPQKMVITVEPFGVLTDNELREFTRDFQKMRDPDAEPQLQDP